VSKKRKNKRILSNEQIREILGLLVAALALLILFSLLPIAWLGPWTAEAFPSGNLVGQLGAVLRALAVAFAGVSSLVLPVLVFGGGLRVGGWLDNRGISRWSVLSVGLLLLLPPLLHLLGAGPGVSGWLGRTLGEPLLNVLGWVGGVVVLSVLLVVLSVATLRFNPLRPAGKALLSVGRGAGRGARWAGAAGVRSARSLADKAKDVAEDLRLTDDPEEARALSSGGSDEDWQEEEEWIAPWAEALEEDQEAEAAQASQPEPVEAAGGTAAKDAEDGFSVDHTNPALRSLPLPPLDLLTASEEEDREDMELSLDRQGEILIEKLKTFNVEARLGGRTTGPVVTQFEVIPAPGVKVNRIANLDADLALAMKARSIRIVAPIPGKGAVGVEVPNPRPQMILLRDILEAPAYLNTRARLPLALGKDLNGRPFVTDLAKMPHVLIAGATGSGKSVCINTIITSLVYRHSPETLRFLMVDPKMVELSSYRDLPHLRHPVVTDPRDAAGALKWAVLEMERRYRLLSENGARSIAEFNQRVAEGAPLRRVTAQGPEGDPDRWVYTDGVLPYIVVVIDELADLMMTVQSEVEKPLTLLAQKARAIGIHLIVATQRPSVNVITGLIKANFPSRIAFRVASKTDSRTIIDQNGADALLGNGDMLFLPPGQSEPVRAQGAFIPTEDTDALTGWYREQAEAHEEELAAQEATGSGEEDILEVVRALEAESAGDDGGDGEGWGDWDELFREAAELCIQNGGGSTSFLQRKLRIGYGRAARISDQLEEAGVLGPSEGARGREVLMTHAQLDAFMSGTDLVGDEGPA
jgi:S-DNA-T family DNA segregation ATPase FtsK/SpoIIIE